MNNTLYTPLEIKQNCKTVLWYLKMPSVFEEHQVMVKEKTIEYQELLKKRIEQFRRELEVYWEQVQEYDQYGDFEQLEKYKKKAALLDSRLVAAMEKIEQINEEETSFGWELSQYPIRKQTHDKLKPYKQLFDAGQGFIDNREMWLNAQVGTFEPEEIDNEMGTTQRLVMKLDKTFGDRPETKKMAEAVC